MTKKTKKTLIILLYGLISMVIGFVFQWVSCPECIKYPKAILMNMGYSLMLGWGLFFNKYLYDFAIKPFVSWLKKPVRSILISFLATTIYSGFVIFFTNWLWFSVVEGMPFGLFLKTYPGIWATEFGILYFISLWFYARAFFLDWKREIKQHELLKREALSAKYDVLKSQVNPHFLFNSLNVASSMVDNNPEVAKQFLSNLSGMYRDVLELQEHDLVPLKRELKLARRYLFLQEMRFGKAFNYSLPDDDLECFRVIPLSVQMLLENVFKHNYFSMTNPLRISIFVRNERLVVQNNIQNQNANEDSLQVGLENLQGRIRFLAQKEIEVTAENGIFEVKLPLIGESLV